MRCANNLKQMGLALMLYADRNREYLPGLHRTYHNAGGARVYPKLTVEGSPNDIGFADFQSFSWGTTMLPFLEQTTLHDSLDYNQAAMAPVNQPGIATVLPVFQCPSTPGFPRKFTGYPSNKKLADIPVAAQDYMPVTKADYSDEINSYAGAWCGDPEPGAERFNPGGRYSYWRETYPAPLSWVTDGLSNTTLMIEQASRPEMIWRRAPDDWGMEQNGGGWAQSTMAQWTANGLINEANLGCHFSHHPAGAQQVMCDGSVRLLGEGTDRTVIRALDSRDTGDMIDPKAFQ